mgnify:FL=1
MFKRPWSLWKPLWRNKDNSRIFIYSMMLAIVAMAIPYSIINHIMGEIDRSVFDPISPVDSWVPFVAWTSMIYVTLYLYYPVTCHYGIKNNERIREMFAFNQVMFSITWLVYVLFIIFPTEIHIRDEIPLDVRSGEGFWGFWIGDFMHEVDKPYNAWPSLHIVQSLMMVLLLRHWKVFDKTGEFIVWLSWSLLCISVMTTKQHFFFDVVTGVVVAVFSWYYLCIPLMKKSKSQEWKDYFPEDQ